MTYDERQLAAALLRCVTCGGSWFTTHPTPGWVCIACRRAAAKGPA